jgi:hypothetical protein
MPIPLIVCAVVLLIGVVAVVMSRDNWRWQNITLVSLFLVLATLFFYLASKNWATQIAWRKEIANYQTAQAKLDKDIKEKREGQYDAAEKKWIDPSLAERRRRVEIAMQGRGRVWNQVTCAAVAPNGALGVNVVQPIPSGIAEKTILFVFDDQPAAGGGLFLGEFEATKVEGQQVTLSPVLPLRPAQLQALGQRRGRPLVLYEIMPTDSYDLYAELDPAVRMALFSNAVPANVKQEFIKDGNPPAENESDASRVWRRVKALKSFTVPRNAPEGQGQSVSEGTELILDPKSAEEMIAAGEVAPVEGNDKVYRRTLRDYARLFRDLNLRIDTLVRSIAETNGQLAVVQEAQKKVDADLALRKKEQQLLTSDLKRFQAERDRMKAHVAALEKKLAEVRGNLTAVYNDNVEKEAELVRLTYELARNKLRQNPVAADVNR